MVPEVIDKAFSRDAISLTGGLGEALFAQPVDGCLDVTLGLVQGLLAIHHANAGLSAEVSDHLGGNFGHTSSHQRFGTQPGLDLGRVSLAP
jgi:hypothetical protein